MCEGVECEGVECLTCAYLVLHDSAVGLDKGLSIEGGFPKQHLVEADTERPPVTLASIHTSTILHCLGG